MSALSFSKKSAKEIKQLCKIYLTNLGVSDISYSYYTEKGDRSVLASDDRLLEGAFGPNRFLNNKPWPSLVNVKRDPWHISEMLYAKVPEQAADFMQSLRSQLGRSLNKYSVITVSQRIGNDLETIEFFSENRSDSFRLMNHVDDLQRFMLLFKDQTRLLREESLKKPLLRSREVYLCDSVSVNVQLPEFTFSRYYLNDAKTYLSFRESECVSLIVQCRSASEVGEVLGISARTVESHIQSVKEKLGCSKQSQLYDALMSSGFNPQLLSLR